MSERISAPNDRPSIDVEDDGLQTEAQGYHTVLMDLGLYPAIALGSGNRILFELGDGPKPGAVDVALIVEGHFTEDPSFQEDFITAVGNIGNFYVAAPATDTALQTADGKTVVKAVMAAGFIPLLADYGQDLGLRLVFTHDETDRRDLVAIDLIRILQRRYDAEPDFRTAVQQHLFSEGPNLTFIA